MADIEWHKAVASQISAKGKRKDAFNKINQLNTQGASDAEITQVVQKLGGLYQQVLKASNPDQAASAAIKEIAGNSSQAVLPDSFYSSVQAINTIQNFLRTDINLSAVTDVSGNIVDANVADSINALEQKVGDTSTLLSTNKTLTGAINDVINTVDLITGVNLGSTINSAFSNIDNSIGFKPIITSTSIEQSLSGGINALKLEIGQNILSSNFASDDVNSFLNMALLLKTLLGNVNNYATSETLASIIVNTFTSQETGLTPSLSVEDLKTDIDTTVSNGMSLAIIATSIITKLSSFIDNNNYNSTTLAGCLDNIITNSSTHYTYLINDLTAS